MTQHLVFLHIHGLGPASRGLRQNQTDKLQRELERQLKQFDCDALAHAPHFVCPDVNWDKLFVAAKHSWAKTLFEDEYRVQFEGGSYWAYNPPWRLAGMAVLLVMLLSIGVWALMHPLFYPTIGSTATSLLSFEQLRPAVVLASLVTSIVAGALVYCWTLFTPLRHEHWRWVFALAGMVAGYFTFHHWAALSNSSAVIWVYGAVLSVLVVFLLAMNRNSLLARTLLWPIRWGDAFSLLRRFEAMAASDIWIYSNDAMRLCIVRCILDELRNALKQAEIPTDSEFVLILSGHSLGSVIAYDLLRDLNAIKSRKAPGTNSASKARQDIWELLRPYAERCKVVGLFTYGSPIALFLFRQPDLLQTAADSPVMRVKQEQLQQAILPPEFQAESTEQSSPGWCWNNYWHHADFVAHRLGPLFNKRSTGRSLVTNNNTPVPLPVVQDVALNYLTSDPISAHSRYLSEPRVYREVAAHVVAWLRHLAPPPIQP